MKTLIVFDLDGTLAESKARWRRREAARIRAERNSTQTLRNGMETVDTSGSCGRKNGRRFRTSLKRRPSSFPS
jgi:phosphoglycolate phosphatase-like HAD superfamily hydrolase